MADTKDTREQKNYGENLVTNEAIRNRVSAYVLEQIKTIVNGRSYLDSKAIMLERLWRGDPVSRFYPGTSTTHVPEPFKAVESLVPRIIEGVMPGPEWFRVTPVEPGQGDPRSIGLLLKQQLDDGDFDERLDMFVRICLIQGTAFAKLPYIWDTRKYFFREKQEKPVYKNGIQIDTKRTGWKKEEYEYNRDRTELLPIEWFDFIADPRCQDPVNAGTGCGDRSRQTKEYIFEMIDKGVYANITKEQVSRMSKMDKTVPMGLGETLKYTSVDTASIARRPEDDFIVTEWWGMVPIDSKGGRTEAVVTFINEQVCVRIQANKLWHHSRPYLVSQYIPIKSELYGMGVIEPIVRLCLDVNDMRNTLNHGAAIAANPMLKVEDSADVEDEVIIPVPGRIIRCARQEGIQPLYIPNMSQIAQLSENMSKQDIVETAGTTRLYYGAEQAGGTTATETYTRTREANVRVKRYIKALGKKMERILQVCHLNNHQFLDEERIVVLTGDVKGYQHLKVTPDKLEGPAKFDVILAPQIELLGVRGQQMMMYMERTMANPMLAGQIDARQLARIIWEDLFGTREVNYIFPEADQRLLSQDDENLLLIKGLEIPVRMYHNHEEHRRVLMLVMTMPEFEDFSPEAQAAFMAHFQNHELWAKRLNEQATNPMNQMMAGPGGEASGAPGTQAPGEQGARAFARQLSEQARQGVQGR